MSPAWSNDSQFVAYGSLFEACSQNFPQITYPYFVSNIFKIKPDGTNKQQITNLTNTNCRLPDTNCLTFGMVWTEDNSKIIAAGRINGARGLFAFNANSGTFTQIPLAAGNAPDFVGGIVQPRVERQVLSFGGGLTGSGDYSLVSTIGEPITGQTSTGGSYNLASGFWAIPAETGKSRFDFDGDGKTDVSVFRPSDGNWYLLQSTAGFTGVTFGQAGDKIVPADYDGDGKTDVAVFRPSSGTWYLQRSNLGFTGILFGASTDVPVPADYDGDGKADVAVFRNGVWYLQQSTAGFTGIAFGLGTDLPAPADYDGDGKADVAVFRSGTWYLNRSTAGFTGVAFGAATDIPIPNAFVY